MFTFLGTCCRYANASTFIFSQLLQIWKCSRPSLVSNSHIWLSRKFQSTVLSIFIKCGNSNKGHISWKPFLPKIYRLLFARQRLFRFIAFFIDSTLCFTVVEALIPFPIHLEFGLHWFRRSPNIRNNRDYLCYSGGLSVSAMLCACSTVPRNLSEWYCYKSI